MNNRVHVHKTAQNSYDKRSSHFPNNRHYVYCYLVERTRCMSKDLCIDLSRAIKIG